MSETLSQKYITWLIHSLRKLPKLNQNPFDVQSLSSFLDRSRPLLVLVWLWNASAGVDRVGLQDVRSEHRACLSNHVPEMG